jgi:hypothetical protein
MKNFALCIFTILTVVFGCQESKDSAVTIKDLSFYKNIGHQITVETGQRWIDTYNQRNNIESGRLILSPYAIDASKLEEAVTSVPDLLGVGFHHAIDDNGAHHFIVIPVTTSFDVWSPIPGRVYIDANNDTEITRAEAREWAQRYEEAHPKEVWYHFFGKNIFEEIPTIPYFETLNIVPALNDLDLSPQLLLIILNDGGLLGGLGGRLKGDNGTVVYDASSPCPPCPVP